MGAPMYKYLSNLAAVHGENSTWAILRKEGGSLGIVN